MQTSRDHALVQRAIRTIRLFEDWPDGALQLICTAIEVLRPVTGETVIARRKKLDGLYAVVAGSLELSLSHVDGRRHIRLYAGAGQVFGFLGLFGGADSAHTYVAREPTAVLFIPKEALLSVLARHPAQWHGVAQEMARHHLLSLASIEAATFDSLRVRLAKALVTLIEGRATREESGSETGIQLSQDALGSVLGVSRQSISKEVKRLEREGLIRISYRCITLLGPEAIRRIAFGASDTDI